MIRRLLRRGRPDPRTAHPFRLKLRAYGFDYCVCGLARQLHTPESQ